MPSREKSAAAWPDVPPSLNHDSLEVTDFDKEQLRPHADTAPTVTPYLGLRARLSQIWFNRWTVLLLLVLVRVLLLLTSLNEQIGDAKTKALSACTKVEDIGSAMASMPHYLSVGVNSLAADGISKAVDAMVEVLMMILTGVEQLILFMINMWVGTYACLIAAFIHGGLDVATGTVEGATKLINNSIGIITQGIQNDIANVQDIINKAFAAASQLSGFFGGGGGVPKIDITGRLNDLKNIKVDSSALVGDLVQLNKDIPTFEQAKNFAEKAISIPFDLVKDKLNSSYAGYSFDKTIFPVAQKEALSFCSNNSFINNFFDSLYKIASTAKIVFIVVICILAVAACVPMVYLEIRRWQRQQRHAYIFTKHGYDSMDVVYIASRPHTATFGIKLASRFRGKRQLWVRWAVAYATSMPALFVLSLALAGFFSCLCQIILLRTLQKEVPALADQVGDFAGEVVTTLDRVSVKWANDANGVITNFNNEINKDVFGYVVNATSAVNNTLNVFETQINTALDTVFNGTILYNTVKNVTYCLLGIKIDTVQKGLTWVHDHAKVSFPLFPNDTFSQGAARSIKGDSDLTSFLATPSSVTTDEVTGAVDHVIDTLHNSIIQEALISTVILLLYILIVVIGVMRSLIGMMGNDKTRGEGGQRYPTSNQEASVELDYAGGFATAPTRGGKGQASTRFPEFDDVSDDYEADAIRDEKLAAASSYWGETTKSVRGGKGGRAESSGHWRTSSRGELGGAER